MKDRLCQIVKLCRNSAQRVVIGFLLAGSLAVCCPCVYASAKDVTTVVDSDEPEVTVRGQYIYVTTQKAMVIRLYSILGQLITQQSVPAGTTRFKAPVRGVYILKAGPVTRRVTINA